MKTDFIHDAAGDEEIEPQKFTVGGELADHDGGRDVDGDAKKTAEMADAGVVWYMVVWYMNAVKAGGALSFAMGHSMALSFATLNS